jgi:hypothetical protein
MRFQDEIEHEKGALGFWPGAPFRIQHISNIRLFIPLLYTSVILRHTYDLSA